MTVFPGRGWPGVLLHEAVGHGLEGDFNRKGSSTFAGRIKASASRPRASRVLDDGTMRRIAAARSTIDDEGNASQRNVLIEDGILRGYIQDSHERLPDGRQAPPATAAARSYAHTPMPRMTNTYMLATARR